MKRLFISLLLLSFSFPLLAVLNGDGYYRVKNVTTERYISVVDNRGHIDFASTTADFGAIRTIRYFDNVVSDPSTIIFFKKVNAGYNLTTQGTSTYKIIGYYMRLQEYEDGTYKAYGESHDMRAYLGDENIRDTIATVVSNNSKTTLWYILPVTQENESYFGIRPEYISDGAYWTTIYASFPFSPVSSDMKAYTITEVDSKYGVAVWNEVTTEDIPAATPVIVRCPSPIPSGNKVDVHTSSVKAPKSNLLQGVYFCNTSLAHWNVVENDTSTMRVLKTASDGSLRFVRSTEAYMPANKAYLQVPAGSPAELRIMDRASYETYVVEQKAREDSLRHVQDSIHHAHDSIASIVADGYYRIRCVETGRYMNLCDDKGSVDVDAHSADLAALRTVSDFNSVVTRPSSVFRITRSEDGYTLSSQSTDSRILYGEPIHFHCDTLTSTWTIWGTSGDWKWMLSDTPESGSEGFVCTEEGKTSTWELLPVTMTGGREIAISPSIQVGRNYYQSYYAAYSATMTAKNSQAYYIELLSTSYGAVVWHACNGKELPASTPLIVSSAFSSVMSNRLTIETRNMQVPENNLLKGVWYDSPYEGHVNRIANDTATIRVLGKGKDGTLCFVRSDEEFLPANSAYISVPAGSPAELKVMGMEEYEEWVAYTDSINAIVPYSTITYYVDDVVYKVDTLYHGVAITPIPEPEREGYTFSGWMDVPSSMPDYDISVYGSFSINTYYLTYYVDGEQYKQEGIVYGASVLAEGEPEKEGHTFSGWSEIPETMPAHDVDVVGSFAVNTYHITYEIDGEVYYEEDLAFGTTIVVKEAPEKEGYSFSGWGDVPETMPASNVTLSGSYSINSYQLTYYLDGELFKQSDVLFGTALEPEPAPEKEGYTFSGWSEVPETMPAHDVTVSGTFIANGVLYKEQEPERVNVYNLYGQLILADVERKTALKNLPAGVYVVDGRKYVVQ
ncbi:MAG: InlB B-repeat-containing protein [Bacteroidaceae bacterium]|nr:InlB B-repeat-containing protein [Bacteroidaceae bacterium]